MAPTTSPEGAFEHCRRLVAETDKERYWASLYAPTDRRDALYALYAFDHEISRVAAVVREPMAGEIRLQWWRDVLDGKRDEEAAASPIAALLLDVVRRHDVPRQQLIDMIDAHAADLYGDATIDIETYGAATNGAMIALAARILGGDNADAQHIASHAGIARVYADAKQPQEARRHLDLARDLLPRVPAEMLPALLPAATIGPSLERATPLPLWRRLWLIWRAGRNPRRIFS
jgi:phytoene synthase